MNPSITIEFSARELIVGIVLLQKITPLHFTVSFSNDGNKWKVYKEYSRTAVSFLKAKATAKPRSLSLGKIPETL